jgi:hypothetical protein
MRFRPLDLSAQQPRDFDYFAEACFAMRQVAFHLPPHTLRHCLVDVANHLLRPEMPLAPRAVALAHARPESMGPSSPLRGLARRVSPASASKRNGFDMLPR